MSIPKVMRGERSGGTVRVRGATDGHRVDVYMAACDKCDAIGPPSPNSQRGARALAKALGWLCDLIRIRRSFHETKAWVVICPKCRNLGG